MKKHHGILTLALLCANSAFADKNVTPVQDQTIESVARRDPAMYQVCKMHLELLANKNVLTQGGDEGCKKVASVFIEAVSAGAESCTLSFDINIRSFNEKSLNETLNDQRLYCTEAEAMLAPCTQCSNTMVNVKRITTTMTNGEIEKSLGMYSTLLPRLQSAATQYSCAKFNRGDMKDHIDALASELKNAEVKAVRFTREEYKANNTITKVPLSEPQLIDSSHKEFPAIRVGTGLGDGVSDAGATTNTAPELASQTRPQVSTASPEESQKSQAQAQTQKDQTTSESKPARLNRKLPPGLNVAGKLSNGGTGFVYSNPSDPSKNYIGFQIRDPKTKKLLTYAYPTSIENVEAITKNPILCDQLLKDVQTRATSNTHAEQDALERGNSLFASLKKKEKLPGDLSTIAKDSSGNSSNTSNSSNKSSVTTETSPAHGDSSASAEADSSATASSQKDLGRGVIPDSNVGLRAGTGPLPTFKTGETGETGSQDTNRTIAQDHPTVSSQNSTAPDSATSSTSAKHKVGTGSDENPDSSLVEAGPQSSTHAPATASQPKKQKPKAVASQKKTTKPAANGSSEKPARQKNSSPSVVYVTPSGFGKIRYFVVSMPPRLPFIGRVIEVNGKSQVISYSLSADEKQVKELSHDYEKLKSAFEKENSKPLFAPHTQFLDQGITNQAMEQFLINEAMKSPLK